MRNLLTTATAVVSLALGVSGHGAVTTPTPRKTGPAQVALCGAAVTKKLESDTTGPIENAVALADADYKCNAYLCRGYQWADNSNNVLALQAGDVLTFHINLVAGHHPGWSNVSVVDMATNTVIGEPLVVFDEWPISNSTADTDFTATIPDSLGTSCTEGGACAIQWYWWSNSNSQTYESCVDFTVGS